MANNTITGSLNNGYIRYASKDDIKSIVDEMTSIESIAEKELRTYRWQDIVYIPARSSGGGTRVSIPRGLPFGEKLNYKAMMISLSDGKDVQITSAQVTFDEAYMEIDWELASAPILDDNGVLTILFYWEV